MADAPRPALIGLDWGTTSARAYLIGPDGAVIEQQASDDGILSVQDGDFEAVFERLLAPWFASHEGLPIIASGMITSRNGWVETPYLQPPAGAEEFAHALRPYVTAAAHRLHFVTGLSTEDEAGAPDVLRGEETEILGHLAADDADQNTRLYVVPGTHSKWVEVSDGQLRGFSTYVTGELFAVLKAHSILGRLTADGPFSPTGFDAGAKVGLETGADLLHALFATRTLPLFERLTPVESADYLSGLLIGAEVAAGLRGRADGVSVTVIGKDAVVERYVRVLEVAGAKADRAEQAMVARGHWEIAHRAGLIS
ncbi:MAG: 2-dehydro-3-deoxygalactonokinase [Pseudomonadota bacterium]